MSQTCATSKKLNKLATYIEKTYETLRTEDYNIRVQRLQHMQHLDLVLQHTYETFATYL